MNYRIPARLLAALLVACGSQEPRPGSRHTADVTIPLNPYFRDLRTVQVRLGRDTLTLLFDTGGGATLITPAVAHRIGCRPYGRDVGYRMSGEPVEFQRCDSVTLELAGWSRRLAPVAVFDVNALLPAELPRLDGVLALDAFGGEVVTVDWPARRLIVHAPATSAAALVAAGLEFRPATGESGRMLTVFARVAGRRAALWFLLDSGNLQGTLIDSRVFGDSLLLLERDSLVALDVGPGRRLLVPVRRATLIMDGVLGTDFLQRGPLTLDLRLSRR